MVTQADKAKRQLDLLYKWLETHDQEHSLNLSSEAIRVLTGPSVEKERILRRWKVLDTEDTVQKQVLDNHTLEQLENYKGNIEGLIGTVKVPVGIAGPLKVNGIFAKGEYFIPLATTEAALVASYHRGIYLINQAGGCRSILLNEGITRSPAFAFQQLDQVGQFVAWLLDQQAQLKTIAESTSNHLELTDLRLAVEGNHVYIIFEYQTGDAAGQNMVTIATSAICTFIQENTPIKPQYYFLEANLSGDKKASMQSFLGVRGKKVTAEIVIDNTLIQKLLHTTAEQMVAYWRMSAIGGVLGGTIGIQGHYANGLTALYLATGQDVACVSESAVGVTRFELTENKDLYASVTLPNLIIGTVGGGTKLPSQKACLDIMGLSGSGHAKALAEICAGLCLAGELSIIGALCAGEFSNAHQKLARGKT